MGEIVPFEREKLICGVLLSRDSGLDAVRDVLEKAFGPADFISPEFDFIYTRYYDAEMGTGIRRVYLSFQRLISPEQLPGIKITANRLETDFLTEAGRQVNLDPGLLSLGRVILASSKDAGHRIPLSGGIYGEVTLVYRFGRWQPLEWTYPDYQSEECREQMAEIRRIFKEQRKTVANLSGGESE